MKRFVFLTMLILAGWCAQAQVLPFRSPRVTFQTSTGQPLSGGCIFTYRGGTTTPQATYTDYTGGTPNPNPVILDSTGSAVMWLGVNNYKFVAYSYGGSNCSLGSLQWTVDQVPGDSFLNGTISGATITNPTITDGTMSGTALSGVTITSSDVESTPIGSTSPAAGSFTSLASASVTVAFSATPVFNASLYGNFTISLTGNVTSSTITGGVVGQTITFLIVQDTTGGRTFAWPANLQTYTLPGVPQINLQGAGYTFVQALYDGYEWNAEYWNTAPPGGLVTTVDYSATPVFAATPYSTFNLTLTGNVSSSTLTGGTPGQIATFNICQDATGGRTFVWPTNLLNAPPVGSTLSTCTGVTAVQTSYLSWTTVGSTATASGLAFNQVLAASPAAPASTSAYQMQGMGATITPTGTGRVKVNYSAVLSSCGASGGDGVYFQFYYGTGTVPTNGAAPSGTQVMVSSTPVQVQYITGGANLAAVPISSSFAVTGLTVGTTYWFDVAGEAATATGCAQTNPVITLQEF